MALRNSEENFRQLLDYSGVCYWELDEEGLYTYCSTFGKTILGYNSEEIIGKKHLCDFFAHDTKIDSRKAILEAISCKESFRNFEIPHIHKNGERVILETNGIPLLDVEGSLVGFRGTFKDVTRHKHTEERLQKVESRFSALVNELTDIFWMMDGVGKPIGETLSMQKFIGQTHENIMKGGWVESVHPEDIARLTETISRTIVELKPSEYEGRLKRFDGEWRILLSKVVPIFENDGTIREWVGAARDITEQRRAEEKIHKNLEELLRWYNITMNRENRVIELKNEINELRKCLGESIKYGKQDSKHSPTKGIDIE